MLLEIFRRLAIFGPLTDYRYVGLGSVWFSDFQLFHRALGIGDMVSIEREKGAEERIRSNIPFAAIRPVFERTSVALPDLDWSKRQIVWLDFDDVLCLDVLTDVQTVAGKVPSGSVVAITLQHQRAAEIEEAKESGSGTPLDLFKSRFDRGLLPVNLEEDDLYGRPFGRLVRGMVHTVIEQALLVRNLGLDPLADAQAYYSYRPICDIEYADGAPMATTVGIVTTGAEASKLSDLDLERLDFYRSGIGPVRIEVPKITPREARLLEQQLPAGGVIDIGNVPESDAKAFAAFYRYLPQFVPIES